MRRILSFLLAGCVLLLTSACSDEESDRASESSERESTVNSDLQLVDGYLSEWDRFAQGENALVPELKSEQAAFEAALTRLVLSSDRRAPARMVFYPVVQIGGSIPADSELGKAAAKVLGAEFPLTTLKDGQRAHFAGDLYLWWEANQHNYEPFSLLDEWSGREFARTSVIPMFRSMAERKQ